MTYAVTFLVDQEPVTLTFNTMNTGMRVMKVLESNFEVVPHQEDVEQIREIRAISGFYMAQPLFVDLMSNAVDFRLGTPKTALCRTTVTADLITIEELEQLQKREVQPATVGPPTLCMPPGAFLPPAGTLPLPQSQGEFEGVQMIAQQNEVAPQYAQMMPEQAEINIPIPATFSSLAPPPLFNQAAKFISRESLDGEQLVKPVQTLITLCAKNHEFVQQMAEYVGQTVQQGDQEAVRSLAAAAAAKILALPITEEVERIQQIPFAGELKEKVLEIMQKQLEESLAQTRPLMPAALRLEVPSLQQFPVQKTEQLPISEISQDEKIKQVYTVLKELPADAVSKLMHGESPSEVFLTARQGLSDHPFNVARFKEDERKGGVVHLTGIIERVLNMYNIEVTEHKSRIEINDEPSMREKIIGLYERYAFKHDEILHHHEMALFHKGFSVDENLIILLKVREAIRPAVQLYDYSHVLEEVETRHLLLIFDKLKNIVDKHKVEMPESEKAREQINASRHEELHNLPSTPPNMQMLQQGVPNLEMLEFQQLPSVFQQPPPLTVPAIKQENPPEQISASAPPPKFANGNAASTSTQVAAVPAKSSAPTVNTTASSTTTPVAKHTHEQREEPKHMSEMQEEIYDDVCKMQDKLQPPTAEKIEELARQFKPIVVAKVFVTILGLGYEYQHLFKLEQSLLHKQSEVLIEQLKIDIQPADFKTLVDELLLALICYILKNKANERFKFTQKQRPQLVRITPQTQSHYEVPQFFAIYQHTCDVLKAELVKGVPIQQKTQFEVFSKEELLEMFEDINIFGDYLEMISCSLE